LEIKDIGLSGIVERHKILRLTIIYFILSVTEDQSLIVLWARKLNV